MSFPCICIKWVSFLCKGVRLAEVDIVIVLHILIECEQVCCSFYGLESTIVVGILCGLFSPFPKDNVSTSSQLTLGHRASC